MVDLTARVLPGTVINDQRGVADPTVVAATAAGLSIIRPNPTIQTPLVNNIPFPGGIGLRFVAMNDKYIAASLDGFFEVYVWPSTIDDSSVDADAIVKINANSALKMMESTITSIAFDAAGLLVVGHVDGLSMFRLHANHERGAWRRKGDGFDTGWQSANCVLAMVGNTEDKNHAQSEIVDNGVAATVNKNEVVAGTLSTELVAVGADRRALNGFIHDEAFYDGALRYAVGTGEFHLRLIVKRDSAGSVFMLGDDLTTQLPPGGFLVHINSVGQVSVYITGVVELTPVDSLPVGAYAIIDLVRDSAGELVIYINGDASASTPSAHDLTSTGFIIGDGHFSKADEVAAVSLSLSAPKASDLKWMADQDLASYRKDARVLIDVNAGINALAVDEARRGLYSAHDGALNDATVIKWGREFVALERTIPSVLFEDWTVEDTALLAVNEGQLLSVGYDVSSYRPPIMLAELAQQRRDYDASDHGTHSARTVNDGAVQIWRYNVPKDLSGAKFSFEIWAHDNAAEEVARYYGAATLYRNNAAATVLDDVTLQAATLAAMPSGFRDGSVGAPFLSVQNNELILTVHGVTFPVPPGNTIYHYWTVKVQRI